MIPFASQRSNGQELASHLMNAEDNEYVELAELRGAVAGDLHGAFAEWEAQARAMTKCQNELYSLSVNPDPAQGPLPRDLYDDYIARVENALGLAGQARAIVFHVKEDSQGQGREHCHVVWSRINLQDCRAIHMAFDHDKLMTVTRQFARDHGIELAPGYHKLEDRKRQTYRQHSLYDRVQDTTSGLSREERSAVITELWHGRDDPGAFVSALDYHGYILASGKRPYVLVDLYGHTNSLPKLIDDKAANTKAIRSFLGEVYDEDGLPSVEEAQALAAQRRSQLKGFRRSQEQADRLDQLRLRQESEKGRLQDEMAAKRTSHEKSRSALAEIQLRARTGLKQDYRDQTEQLKAAREAVRPKGLTAFFAKATGFDFLRRRLHKRQDEMRQAAFLRQRQAQREAQRSERDDLERRQQMQQLELRRKDVAMDKSHARQEKSLKASFVRQHRTRMRRGYEHMPSMGLHLGPPGRPAMPYKAKNRYISPLAVDLRKDKVARSDAQVAARKLAKARSENTEEQSSLRDEFRLAASKPKLPSEGTAGKEPAEQVRKKSHKTRDGEGGRKR